MEHIHKSDKEIIDIFSNKNRRIDISYTKKLSIFKEAKERKRLGYGYNSDKVLFIWKNKNVGWNVFYIRYGLCEYKKIGIFNTSNNSDRSLRFVFFNFNLTITYSRKRNSNYLFKYPYYNKLRTLYLLLF